jgi:GLPGLI family protein
MKIIIILTISFINFTYSQSNFISVNYELTRELNGHIFTAKSNILIDTKNKVSIFKLNQYENLLKNGKKMFDKETNDTIVVLGSTSICTEPKQYFFDFKNKAQTLLLYNVNCKSKVLVEEKLEYPKWQIHNEFKEISGYKTQKATTTINDRTWTVYFTKNIKENIAPWRLFGLPGTIVEATENTSIYKFKLVKIEKDYPNEIIEKPSFNVKSSFENYVLKSVKEKRDEMIYKMSQMEGVNSEDIDPDTFPHSETIDFIEKRK